MEQWTRNLGPYLLRHVTVTVGGHSEKHWHCQTCGHDHKLTKPNVCNYVESVFNFEKYLAVNKLPPDTTEDEIDYIEDANYHDTTTCTSTLFVWRTEQGQVLDRYSADELDLWSALHDTSLATRLYSSTGSSSFD